MGAFLPQSIVQDGVFSNFKSYLQEKLNPKKYPDFWIGSLALISFILNVIPVVNLIPFDYVFFPAIACLLLFSIGLKLYDKKWHQPEQKAILALLITMILPATLKILDIFGVINIGPTLWCSIALLVLAAVIDKQTTISKVKEQVFGGLSGQHVSIEFEGKTQPCTLDYKDGKIHVSLNNLNDPFNAEEATHQQHYG